MPDLDNLHDLLRQIARLADAAAMTCQTRPSAPPPDEDDPPLCTPVRLPTHLQVRAAQTATRLNPANAPRSASFPPDVVVQRVLSEPQRIAVLTSKYWGPSLRRLTVSFLGTVAPELRTRILSHLNAWQCGITFIESGVGQVRISLGPGGYWSYLGTDILHIAPTSPTMNLQGFTMQTPESEFKRVIRHEAGHSLGFPHEHLRRELVERIDPEKAYAFFQLVYGWDRATVDAQVLTPLDEYSIYGTPTDMTSCMCYQLPGRITRDGQPILGGIDINPIDRQFAQRIYPLGEPGMPPQAPAYVEHARQPEAQDAGFLEEPLTLGD